MTRSKLLAALKFIITILIIGNTVSATAQSDDPNLDQVPVSMWNRVIPPNLPYNPASSVITINNWDNFNLGVDFGESNMAANSNFPTWYYTAYNINNGHYSNNGIDWVAVTPDFGAVMHGDPVVASDSLGNLYYENLYGTSSILGVMVIRSTDNGASWGPGIAAASGNDKCWLACDQTNGPYTNNVYACLTNYSTGYFARSTDHGATWQNTFNPATQNLPGMMVCVGAYGNVQGGAVYVVTNSGLSEASTYTFYRSTDGGVTFTLMSAQNFSGYVGTFVNGRNSVEGMRTRPYPMIAADNSFGPHRGRLYIVYASNYPPGNGNKPDIWCHYSDDGGTNWSPALRVNDDVNTQSNNQWHPAIWCDKETGKLYVQWMDTRDTPTSDSAFIYATYSSDGGVTFAANQRISNNKMKIDCPTCGGGGTPRYQGDYNGIVSNKKVAMAGWTDFRYGTFLSATAYFPDFAMSVDKSVDTLYIPTDSIIVNVSIPEVKLYSDTVVLSGSVHPVPAGGSITFSFPSGNRITGFPGSKPVRIILSGDVPLGNYDAWLEAASPNGTPVHRRIVTIRVPGSVLSVNAAASPSTFCAGNPSQLNAVVNGGISPFTYAWTPSTGLSDPAIENPVAIPSSTITYTVTVTDNTARVSKDSVLLTVEHIPAIPGEISGPDSVCRNTITIHSIAVVPEATTYTWSVPQGDSIISGQGTGTVAILWSGIGGALSVFAGNNCGNSPEKIIKITVTTIPAPAGIINGKDTVCMDKGGYSFTVNQIQSATTYLWTLPPGSSITAGEGSRNITMAFTQNAVSGDIGVAGINVCDTGTISIKHIIVNNCTGIEEQTQKAFISVSPNPASASFNLIFLENEVKAEIILLNVNGRVVLKETVENPFAGFIKQIDISSLAKGIYFLKVVSDNRFQLEKIAKN